MLNNEYIECVLELQKSLEEVEKTHRHSVLTIDSKLRENEQHLEEIEDTLVDELNNLRQDIEDGKNKLLNEFEKLKKLRHKSEEVFLKSLKEIEEKYLIIDQILASEEEKFKDWDMCLEKSTKSLDFERDVYLLLVDVLYNTKGKCVYSDILNTSAEFSYLSSIIDRGSKKDIRWSLQKAFHVNFSDVSYDDSTMSPRIFVSLSTSDLKQFLTSRTLPSIDSCKCDESFPGKIALDEGNHIIVTLKTERNPNLRENTVISNWTGNKLEKIFIEFVLVINWISTSDSLVFQNMNEDERLVEVISNWYNLPAESVAMIKNLEREIFEKFADNERRVWGELEPNALSKYKSQQDELSKLHSTMENLKSKIEEERNTQEKILREMREALIGPSGSSIY